MDGLRDRGPANLWSCHLDQIRCSARPVCAHARERGWGREGRREEGRGRGEEMPSQLLFHSRSWFATRDAEHDVVMSSVSGSWRGKCKYPSNSYIQVQVRTLTRCKVKRVCDLLPPQNTRRHRYGYSEGGAEKHTSTKSFGKSGLKLLHSASSPLLPRLL